MKIAKISERNTLHRKVALLRIEIGTRAQFLQSLRLHQIVVPHLAFYPKKREKQVVIIIFFFNSKKKKSNKTVCVHDSFLQMNNLLSKSRAVIEWSISNYVLRMCGNKTRGERSETKMSIYVSLVSVHVAWCLFGKSLAVCWLMRCLRNAFL